MNDDLPTVAVTGASGFTGGALVRRLLDEQFRVRSLARDPSRVAIAHPLLEVVKGDLSNIGALDELVCGTDIVFHIAAMFRSEGPYEEFLEVNYRGTVNLLEAARTASVRRFVHCSTIGVHGHVDSEPADENSPFNPCDHYHKTKLMAEEACREQMAKAGMEVVIVRPCSIYGPGDMRMLKMFRMLSKGVFPMVGDGRPNFHPIYVDDLVEGFMLAANHADAPGEAFIIGGSRYFSLNDFVAMAAAAVGASPPRIRIPYLLMESAARACEAVCKPFNLEPPLHRRRLSFFKHNRAFRIKKALEILGFEPQTGLKEGFRRTVDWYRSENYLADDPSPATRGQAPER